MGRYIFFLILLVGCHRNYQFHTAPIPLVCTDLGLNVDEAYQTSSFVAEALPSGPWWEMFGDAQLSEFIDFSLCAHPEIKLAKARVRLAAEEAMLARSSLIPHVNADPAMWRQKVGKFASLPPPELDIYSEAFLNLTATFDLDLWGRNRAEYQAGLDEMQAAYADRMEAQLLLATTITQVYFALQGNLARLVVTKERFAEKTELYALLRQQFVQGIAAEFFVYETEQQLALIQDQIDVLEGEIAAGRHAIAALVGNLSCCAPEICQTPAASFGHRFPLPCSLPLDLISRRPEIQAQIWRLEAAGYGIWVAQANFYPNVDLLGYTGYKGTRLTKLLQADSFELFGLVAVHLPVFTAGKLQAELGVAREEYEIVGETYNQMVLTAVQEVCDAMTSVETSDKQKGDVERALHAATQIYKLNAQRYETGLGDKIAVLNSEDTVLVLRDLTVQVDTARLLAIVSLIKAIGGGYGE